MADVVSEGKEFKVQEAVQNNTKNLEDVFRANERAGLVHYKHHVY